MSRQVHVICMISYLGGNATSGRRRVVDVEFGQHLVGMPSSACRHISRPYVGFGRHLVGIDPMTAYASVRCRAHVGFGWHAVVNPLRALQTKRDQSTEVPEDKTRSVRHRPNVVLQPAGRHRPDVVMLAGIRSMNPPPRWPSGKASASRAEGPGFESRLRRNFFGVESCQ